MSDRTIGSQVNLPWAVAAEVVAQGIRIRMGRSLVTLAGVVFGIAFLASILAGSVARLAVEAESTARADAARMRNQIEAEVGPLKGRGVSVVSGATNTLAEQRLVDACREAGADLSGTTPVITLLLDGGVLPATATGLLAHTGASVALPTSVHAIDLRLQAKPEDLAREAAAKSKAVARSWWVTGIALAVTAIGITNAMLMSVTERFREIGTMKCLGALSSFIRRIFFLESALLGLVGGLSGTVLGFLVALIGYSLSYGFASVFGGLAWGTLLLQGFAAILASVVLAVGAAIYPAAVAARMRPSDALRSNV